MEGFKLLDRYFRADIRPKAMVPVDVNGEGEGVENKVVDDSAAVPEVDANGEREGAETEAVDVPGAVPDVLASLTSSS